MIESSLAEHLAIDECLLLRAEAGWPEVLRFWEWPSLAVVLGAGGKLADEVDDARCEADGVPILRRASGGGTVLLGSGCLVFSLVLSFDRHADLAHVVPSYRWIGRRLAHALDDIAPGIVHAGISDLAWQGRKVSGNSQQRKRRHVLHHGTLLYAFDLSLVARYLRTPARQPDYRQGRDHVDFLINLPAMRRQLEDALRREWSIAEAGPVEPKEVKRLVDEKYGQPEWTQRR